MTREQFNRATELDKEIQKYADLIGRIMLGITVKRNEDEKAEKEHEEWTLSRFFRLTFRGEKVIAMPHYEFAQGIEMDADAELIKIIIDYWRERRKNAKRNLKRLEARRNERSAD